MSFGISKCQNIANKMQYSFDSIGLLTSDAKSKASKRGSSTRTMSCIQLCCWMKHHLLAVED